MASRQPLLSCFVFSHLRAGCLGCTGVRTLQQVKSFASAAWQNLEKGYSHECYEGKVSFLLFWVNQKYPAVVWTLVGAGLGAAEFVLFTYYLKVNEQLMSGMTILIPGKAESIGMCGVFSSPVGKIPVGTALRKQWRKRCRRGGREF